MQTTAVQRKFNDERLALGLPPKEIEDRDDVIQFALDYATPGPLSTKSRETWEEMQWAGVMDEFVLGEEELADMEGVRELSDEEEAELLKQLDEEALEFEGKQKEEVRV